MECEQISKDIDVLVNEREEYVEKGVEFIELMQNIEIIYDKAPLEKKRELVELVISNPVLCDGKLHFELREPFKYLVFDDKKNPETSSGCFLEKWGGKRFLYRTFLIQNLDSCIKKIEYLKNI